MRRPRAGYVRFGKPPKHAIEERRERDGKGGGVVCAIQQYLREPADTLVRAGAGSRHHCRGLGLGLGTLG